MTKLGDGLRISSPYERKKIQGLKISVAKIALGTFWTDFKTGKNYGITKGKFGEKKSFR